MKTLFLRTAAATLTLLCSHANAEPVSFDFSRDLAIGNSDVPYHVKLELAEVATTRIGVDATVDLRDIQRQLPALLTGATFTDACNAEISLDALSVRADDKVLTLVGRFELNTYKCRRSIGQPPEREAQLATGGIEFTTSASAVLRDQCIYFELADVGMTLNNPPSLSEDQEEFLQTARSVFLRAGAAISDRFPICPELPADLASLDPDYRSGGTYEIGDGGAGVRLMGSFDVSTATILDVLAVLQAKGVLPPKP